MTNKRIAWITDSTAFITKELEQHQDVYVMPLTIAFSSGTYEDGIDLSSDDLYMKLKAEKEVPKTSQPSVGKFAELFEKLKADYDCAIAVHISSKLSGTLNSCMQGAEIAGFPVETVDSKMMSYIITGLLNKGIELQYQDTDWKEIAQTLRLEANQFENYILLGNLDQFYKGGRMSGTQYLLGSILKVKPIIHVDRNGEFQLFDKVRSEKKAVRRMIELLEESAEKHRIKQVQIMHGNVLEKAQEIEKEILTRFPEMGTFIGEISSTIAVHAGEGTVAVVWHFE
ncbi:DegV family protein [Bacillus infantis]|uniref:DegV family protein n=1 Tax=Bacillus infantis TaxID=324767 RepID=UPI000B9C6749|nr:DegV family protein [Bacillus infantis]MCK6206941.1 DegV family protein [Bacillus infantis]OXT15905.1 fatty acid-binding protein DegV [Bacillus sp. OG2]